MTSDNPAHPLVPVLASLRWRRRVAALAGAIVLGLTAACAADGLAAPSAPPTSTASLWQAVVDELGEGGCRVDSQCHSLAVGHKPCGGPASFLAWSDQASREAVLRQRVARYTQAQQAEAQAEGRVSTCSVLSDPGAHCDAARQRCALNSGAATRPVSAR